MNKENGRYTVSSPEQPFRLIKIFIPPLISKCGLEVILCLYENQADVLVCPTILLLHIGFAPSLQQLPTALLHFGWGKADLLLFVKLCLS